MGTTIFTAEGPAKAQVKKMKDVVPSCVLQNRPKKNNGYVCALQTIVQAGEGLVGWEKWAS